MSYLNIGGDKADRSYRYKMPVLTIKVEGSGNGIKTVLTNMVEVANALHVIPQYPVRFVIIILTLKLEIEPLFISMNCVVYLSQCLVSCSFPLLATFLIYFDALFSLYFLPTFNRSNSSVSSLVPNPPLMPRLSVPSSTVSTLLLIFKRFSKSSLLFLSFVLLVNLLS